MLFDKSSNVYRICIYNKSDIECIFNYMYYNTKYFMERKKEKFNKYFNDNGNGEHPNVLVEGEDMV